MSENVYRYAALFERVKCGHSFPTAEDRMSEELSDGFETKTCFECQGQMHVIRVIDHANAGVQAELSYSSTDRTPSWFTSYYKEVGKLAAYMCTQCGAVRFYARPFKKG